MEKPIHVTSFLDLNLTYFPEIYVIIFQKIGQLFTPRLLRSPLLLYSCLLRELNSTSRLYEVLKIDLIDTHKKVSAC